MTLQQQQTRDLARVKAERDVLRRAAAAVLAVLSQQSIVAHLYPVEDGGT